MESQDLHRLKELEEENGRLKHMYAELALDNKILKDVLSKKFQSPASVKTWLLMWKRFIILALALAGLAGYFRCHRPCIIIRPSGMIPKQLQSCRN